MSHIEVTIIPSVSSVLLMPPLTYLIICLTFTYNPEAIKNFSLGNVKI